MSEAKKKMTEEEILKSIDAIIDETLGTEEQPAEEAKEEVAKSEESKDTDKDANGGKDKIKSGSPMSAEQAEKAKAKKSEDEKEEDEEDEKEESKKSEEKEADLQKADKEAMKKLADKEAKEEVKEHEKEKHKKSMKKSIEELSQVLDSEELELIKAWREESEQAEKEASTDVAKSVVQAVSAQIEDLKKAFDARLNEKDSLIKSMSDEIKKLSSQPAHSGQAVSTLETLEKGGSSETTLSKSQVLDTMLDLQKAGKGITSQHIAEFEVTKNLSNPAVRALVMEEAKKRHSN
jgi:hypothetical protein